MRPVFTAEATSDHVVAKPIHNADGSILLRDGVRLTYAYRRRLVEMGITQVYVRDPLADDVEVADVVSEATRARLTKTISEILFRVLAVADLRDLRSLDLEPLRALLGEVIDEMRDRDVGIYSHIGIRPVDNYTNYTAFHSASCVLLALAVAMRAGWKRHRLEEIALAEALHDLGKARINQRLLYKPGRLTDDEFAEIQRHPGLGHEILKTRDDISPRVARVALHHHEKMNGKGYPLGIGADRLSPLDRLAAVVDVFDALASERIYKPRKTFDETLGILERETEAGLFDPEHLARLKETVPRHPVGSLVALSTGEVGIVAGYAGGDLTRPVVRPLYRPDGSAVEGVEDRTLGGGDVSIVKECAPTARPRPAAKQWI